MIPINVSLSYYKIADIQEEIISNSRDREIAARFNEQFGKRPDVLRHASDILELAKQGATSFHASEELWKNPLQLDSSMRRQELDDLRIGWDLIIDIDCAVFDYSKIAADLVIKALKFHKIKSISCKFSGNKGWHIVVPFEAMPKIVKRVEIAKYYPEIPQLCAQYLLEFIKPNLERDILQLASHDIKKLVDIFGTTRDKKSSRWR